MNKSVLMATAAVGFALLPSAAANAQSASDWSGGYIGVYAGYLWGDIDIDSTTTAIGQPIAGGLLGYNFPIMSARPVQLGLEADVGAARAGTVGVTVTDGLATYTYDLEWDAHFRVRAGVPGGTVMPFVAAGLALANLGNGGFGSPDALMVGGTVGGGLDVKLGPKLVGRVEGLGDFYASKQVNGMTMDFHAFTARAALILRLP